MNFKITQIDEKQHLSLKTLMLFFFYIVHQI